MGTAVFTTSRREKVKVRHFLIAAVLLLSTGIGSPAFGQQFNSDNWWLLPLHTGMGLVTIGQKYSIMYLGYGFAKGWEIDIAPTIYRADSASGTPARYSTTAYVKHLFWENRAVTSGVAVMAGIGQSPGYYQAETKIEDLKSYWAAFPLTLPFFGNTISWDIMPGFMFNRQYGTSEESAWGFSYSSRVAIYKIVPSSAIVGEVFGAAGEAQADPQFKAGVRFESKYVVAALTYGDGLKGNDGGGLEIGIMIFTVPWP